ncbi:kynureninase [Paraflavisolibacter sp. H34]|uniref:kynureninase n=1 Tax=Huijunlia imazamoxiresistens TaxID=3127457 RepID=UPI0030179204
MQPIPGGSVASFRSEFILPSENGREQVYFLGNSLGLQPKRAAARLQQVLEGWGHLGVEAYFEGGEPWLEYHDLLAPPLARIVGALPQEVVVMNSLSVNLHLMLVSFYRPRGRRNKILCEAKAFPSDQYVLETHTRQRGLDPADVIIEVGPREGETWIRQEDILDALHRHRHELALVFWGGVSYYTGQVFDLEGITRAAHEAGIPVGFDLAHAAGNIPLALHHWGVDFACWCHYKYLNAGPGAIAGAFIHERHHSDKELNRFAGWWGYRRDERFRMQKGFRPQPGAEGWHLSAPSPLLCAPLRASLELFMEAGPEALFQQGQQLSDHLLSVIAGVNRRLGAPAIRVLTPADAKGCQVSLLIEKGARSVFEHLGASGVFSDWREPGVIRVAPVPLYNTFYEVEELGRILEEGVRKV